MAGRPRSSGKVWTEFTERKLWVDVAFTKWRDGHSSNRRAIDTMLRRGWGVLVCDAPLTTNPETGYAMPDPDRKRSRKLWAPYLDVERLSDFDRGMIVDAECSGRQNQPEETLRKKHIDVAKRYAIDAEFHEGCDRDLQFQKERHRSGDSGEEIRARG